MEVKGGGSDLVRLMAFLSSRETGAGDAASSASWERDTELSKYRGTPKERFLPLDGRLSLIHISEPTRH